MTRLFYPSPAEAVTCRRCGNTTPADADTCPHCGADHGGGVLKAGNAAALPTGLRMPFSGRKESVRVASPYPSIVEKSDLIGIEEQNWDKSKTVTLGAVLLALIAGGLIYSQRSDNDGTTRAPAGQSVSGSIDETRLARDSAAAAANKSATGTLASTLPAPAPVTALAKPAAPPAPAVANVAPATRQSAAAAQRQAASQKSATVAQVAPSPAAPTNTAPSTAIAPGSVTDNLQAARDAIDRGDLTTARRRFAKIPASQLDTPNIQRTAADLARLERTRDDNITAARDCQATGSWACVRQNAREVLTVDASNVEAQAMVEQAITRSGWLNGTPPSSTRASAPSTTTAAAAVPVTRTSRPLPRAGTAPSIHEAATAGIPRSADDTRAPMSGSYSRSGGRTHNTPATYVPPTVVTNDGLANLPSTPPARSAAAQTATEPVAASPRASTVEDLPPMPLAPAALQQATQATSDLTRAAVQIAPPAPSPAAVAPAAVAAPATAPATAPAPTPVAAAPAPVAKASTPSTRATSFAGATPDDEERAIRENGWKKATPVIPPAPQE